MSKRRVTLRVGDDEMVLVGERALFEHLVEVYTGMAEWYPDNHQEWEELAEWVRAALARTKQGYAE